MPMWGFLLERIDERIAVSEQARTAAESYAPGEYHVVPNGILVPDAADTAGREHRVAFVGRHEPRKGLHVALRAWPRVRERTGARLRVIGSDPLAVRLLLSRLRVSEDGIDVLGFLSQEHLTEELLAAKVLAAPSVGGESFGMVLTRAFACATPAVASDIPGYRDVMTAEAGLTVPPGEPDALAGALIALLEDEPRRERLGQAARRLAEERYSWGGIARSLVHVYERALGRAREPTAVA
jgi:phosphatidylinositol alpha-mannosyltransferase